jgi:2-succinyl-6-hydroxy-2,4-cyclohexadiene-1-carboxylate synthase
VLLYSETAGTGPRLVLVHGFTQTSACWGPVADALAEDHTVVRVDAPGHGRSADIIAGLRGGARLIADRGHRATYLGYSMGARYCLHLALSNPELVDGLVLLGGTAGIEDPAERAARAADDERLATQIEHGGVDAFLDAWMQNPLFAGQTPEQAMLDVRRQNTAAGLAMSLRQAGTGVQDPLWAKLERLSMPVLVLAGARDDKFTALGRRIADTIGDNATFAAVLAAGHAAHLERPHAFLAVVRPWLAQHGL